MVSESDLYTTAHGIINNTHIKNQKQNRNNVEADETNQGANRTLAALIVTNFSE